MNVALILTLLHGDVYKIEGLPADRPFTLGSGPTCQARVRHPLVLARAVDFVPLPESGSFDITLWDGGSFERRTIKVGEVVLRGRQPFQFQLVASGRPQRDLDAEVDAELGPIHHLTVSSLGTVDFKHPSSSDVVAVEERRPGRRALGILAAARVRRHLAGRAVKSAAEDRLLGTEADGPAWRRPAAPSHRARHSFQRLTEQALKITGDDVAADRLTALHAHFDSWWATIRVVVHDVDYLAARFIHKAIKDMVFGDGPLEDLLASPLLSEVMVNPPRAIYVERDGRLFFTGRSFPTNESLANVISRLVSRADRRVDPSSPLVDVRLVDGSRAHIAPAPVAVGGPR